MVHFTENTYGTAEIYGKENPIERELREIREGQIKRRESKLSISKDDFETLAYARGYLIGCGQNEIGKNIVDLILKLHRYTDNNV